jgi:hypothetical protein
MGIGIFLFGIFNDQFQDPSKFVFILECVKGTNNALMI